MCDNYESFISKANKELGGSIDATYGIKGIAVEWGDMSGGAGQIVTPFGGDILEKYYQKEMYKCQVQKEGD